MGFVLESKVADQIPELEILPYAILVDSHEGTPWSFSGLTGPKGGTLVVECKRTPLFTFQTRDITNSQGEFSMASLVEEVTAKLTH